MSADYKTQLKGLAKSNPETLERAQRKEIHKTLATLLGDKELLAAVNSYGQGIDFASGRNPNPSFNGYSHLEIVPEKSLQIVITEVNNGADSFSENHDSRYPLYVKKGRVYFTDEHGKEHDAAATVRHQEVFGCNVDYSLAQTAETITTSLGEELAKRNRHKKEEKLV